MRKYMIALAVAALATPALAGGQWTAVPVKPSAATGFIGSTVVWDCTASGCTSQSDTSNADPRDECVGVVRQVGPLSSFTGDSGPFDQTKLAACNDSGK